MRSRLLLSTAALLLLATPALAQECQQELAEFNEEAANYRVTSEVRRAIVSLHEAAQALQARGDEETCRNLVADMRDLLEEQGRPVERQAALPEGGAEGEIAVDPALDTDQARLAQAQPLSGIVRLDALQGMSVRNPQDEDLGTLTDFWVDFEGKELRYAILARGGFLGLGESLYPVPVEMIRVAPDTGWADPAMLEGTDPTATDEIATADQPAAVDEEATAGREQVAEQQVVEEGEQPVAEGEPAAGAWQDLDEMVVVLNLTPEQLDAAPSFARGDLPDVADQGWHEQIASYYRDFLGAEAAGTQPAAGTEQEQETQ